MRKQLVLICFVLLSASEVLSQQVYYTESNNGRIRVANLNPGNITSPVDRVTGLASVYKIAVAQNTAKLYYTVGNGGELHRANLNTGAFESLVSNEPSMAELVEIAYYPDDDGLFGAIYFEAGGLKFIPGNNNNSGSDFPVSLGALSGDVILGLAVDNDAGMLYFGSDEAQQVFEMSIGSGTPTALFSVPTPLHIAHDAMNNDLFVVSYTGSEYDLYRYDLDNNALSLIANLGAGDVDDLAVYPGFGKVYYSVYDVGIFSRPLAGGAATTELSLSGAGNISFDFQFDLTPPVFSVLSPIDGATNVSPNPTFSMTFSEIVQVATATGTTAETSISIVRSSDNFVVETISRSSGNISISGQNVSFTTSTTLSANENYYILIGNKVFRDRSANNFIGISLTTGWNFTTTPGMTSNIPTAVACEGTYKNYPDIVLTESGSGDISNGSGTLIFQLGSAGYTFENTIGTVTAQGGGDLSISSFSISNTAITINYAASSESAIDVITISGLKMRSSDAANAPTTVFRSGGTGIIAGLNVNSAIANVNTQAQPAPPTFVFNSGNELCENGDPAAVSVTTTASSIRWFTEDNLLSSSLITALNDQATVSAADLLVDGTTPGTVSRYVRQNVGGCISLSAPIDFVINTNPQAIVTDAEPLTSCATADGSVSVTSVDGAATSGYTFTWVDQASNPIGTGATVSGLLEGIYTAEVVNTATGCVATAAVTIPDERVIFNVSITPTSNTHCQTPNGSAEATILNFFGVASDYTFTWYNGADTDSPVNSTSTGTSLAGLASGAYTLHVIRHDTQCEGIATVIVEDAFNFPEPFIPAGDVCESSPGSGSANVSLTTYNATITGGDPDLTVVWKDGSGNAITNGVVSDNDELTYELTNIISGCTSANTLQFTLHVQPSTANAGSDQAICGTTTTMDGNIPVAGTGGWTILSGIGGSVTTPSSPTSAFVGIAGQSYTLRWQIAGDGFCADQTDETIITLDVPSTTAVAGSDQTVCNGPVTLAANTPTTGTGAWSVETGAGGTFSNPASPTAEFTGTPGSVYTLRWTISGGCSSSHDDVQVTITAPPEMAAAGPDLDICGTNASLSANSPTVGSGNWSILSGAGGVFGDAASANSTFVGTAGVSYTLRWTITSASCLPSTDDIVIVFSGTPTTANAGADKNVCGASVAMTANTPTVGSGLWTVVSGTGGSFSDTSSPTATFTGSAGTTYVLRWTISSGGCTASQDDVSVALSASPTTAAAGSDQNVCTLQTNLSANTPTIGTGVWTIVSGAGGTISNPSNPASAFTGLSGTTYILRWSTTNGSCTASTDDVSVTVNAPVTTSVAGADIESCQTTVTLAANSAVSGIGQWSVLSGTGGVITSPGVATSTFTGIRGNTYILRWTISKSGCTSSTDDLTVQINALPQGTGIINQPTEICLGESSTLSVSGYTNTDSYDWDIPAGFSSDPSTGSSINVTAQSGAGGSITVTPRNSCGIGNVMSASIAILPLPSVSIQLPEAVLPETPVLFSVSSDQTIANSDWSLGDGTTSNATSVEHAYNAPGSYEITVSITSDAGCTNSESATYTVLDEPQLPNEAIKNVITANGDDKNRVLYIENLDRYPENEVRFLDRWGVEIFYTKDYQNDWEARGKDGQFLPAGQYICIVKLDKTGKVITRTVSIIKSR